MAEYSFSDLLGTAATAPESSSTNRDIVVPDGRYSATVVVTNSSINAKGKLVIGLKFRIDDEGPAKSGGVWGNQYLSPESPVALEIFFSTFETLGVPRTHWGQFGTDFARAGADVATRVKGAKVQIVVEADNFGPKVKYINRLPNANQTAANPWGTSSPASSPAAAPAGFALPAQQQQAPAVSRPELPF